LKALITPFRPLSTKGGIETFSYYLTRAFPDLSIITNGDLSPRDKLLASFGQKTLNLIPYSFFVDNLFLKRSHKENFEVVFINGYYGWFFTLKKLKVPTVVIFHGCNIGVAEYALKDYKKIIYCYHKYYLGLFDYLSAKGKTVVVSVSSMVQYLLKKHYGIDSIVIPNCVDIEYFKPSTKESARELLNLPIDKEIVLSVSASYRKGFNVVLELAKRKPNSLFIVISQSKINITPKNMLVFSDVPDTQMPLFYSAADYLVFPSRYEGFSIAALEAMACDLPIITSDMGAFYGMDYSQPFGRVLPLSATIEEYEKATVEVFNDRSLHPRSFVQQNFTLDIFIKNYRNLVRSVLL
jgi:glycosyltransferase involved in cell wall biosynthesis